MELIDRDALIEEMLDKEPLVWNDDDHEWGERNQWQYDMATIEAMPVIDRPKGEWMGTVCSNCGESTSFYYDCKFCPNCGADMRGLDK